MSFNYIAIVLTNSALKAVILDGFGAYLLTKGDIDSTKISTYTAFISYSIRDITRAYYSELGEDYKYLPYLAGIIGGGLKYSLKGQNIILGSLNNLSYELIKDAGYDTTDQAMTISTTLIEGLEGAIDGIMNDKIIEKCSEGLVAGVLISVLGNYIYAPIIQEVNKFQYEELQYDDQNIFVNQTNAEVCLITDKSIFLSNDFFL